MPVDGHEPVTPLLARPGSPLLDGETEALALDGTPHVADAPRSPIHPT